MKKIEVPYELPEGWEWVRIDQLAQAKGGKRVPKGLRLQEMPTPYPYLRVTDMKNETILPDKIQFASIDIQEKIKNYTISLNDLYLTIAGTIGNVGKIPKKYDGALLTENALKLITYKSVNNDFLLKAITSNIIQNQFTALFKQVAQPKLSIRSTNSTLVPFPPQKEQEKILERIENCLNNVELIEQEQKMLQQISTQLKQSVLDIAMRGKLVPQDPNDEPASVLLEQIREEKQKLYEEGKLKKRDLQESVFYKGDDNSYYTDNEQNTEKVEVPFELPSSWTWSTISEVSIILNGDRGKNYPSKTKLLIDGKIPFISASNIKNGRVSEEDLLYLSDEQFEKLSNGKLIYGDIVYCIRGSLGKAGIFDFMSGAIASSLVIIRDVSNTTNLNVFFLYYLNSTLADLEIKKYDNGTAQPNLAARDLKRFLIPIPTSNEQLRIVKTIDKLFTVIGSVS